MTSLAHLTCALLVSISTGQFCPTLHADFLRRQSAAPFHATAPYNKHGSKHVPYISINGTKAVVTVGDGSPYHPMVASGDPAEVHFVTHIYVLDQDGGFVAMDALNPVSSKIARMEFDIPAGVTKLQAFEWCNKHGLWKGPEANVTAGSAERACAKDDVDKAAQFAFVADLERRQATLPFSSPTPFNETHGAKHVPFITLNGSVATVTVGNGKPFHPMAASSDPTLVHFVTHIYVLDQDGKIVSMESLDPNGVDKASITFEVPQNASSLTAYEFCNKHGLWKGPAVQVIDHTNSKPSGSVDSGTGLNVIVLTIAGGFSIVMLLGCMIRFIFQARGYDGSTEGTYSV